MKKLILLITGLLATVSLLAQGNASFANKGTGLDAPVTDRENNNAKLAGADFLTQLYIAPKGAPESALVPLLELSTSAAKILPFRTGAAVGYIVATAVVVKGYNKDDVVQIQMRAWSANGGATYEAAHAAAMAAANAGQPATIKVGASNIFEYTLGGPPATPPFMTALKAFDIHYVPEPSILALGVLGGVAFLLRRRS